MFKRFAKHRYRHDINLRNLCQILKFDERYDDYFYYIKAFWILKIWMILKLKGAFAPKITQQDKQKLFFYFYLVFRI